MKKRQFPKITRRGYVVLCKHGLMFYWDKFQAKNARCNINPLELHDVVPVRIVPYRKGV